MNNLINYLNILIVKIILKFKLNIFLTIFRKQNFDFIFVFFESIIIIPIIIYNIIGIQQKTDDILGLYP